MARIGIAAAVLALLLPTTSGAVDGVFELSQTCAENTGCLPGDGGGFPITIGQSGSYRLTSDLVVPDENTTGITVSASDVKIDLNGFAIVTQSCLGATSSSCASVGVGDGINTSGITYGITVSGGNVVGMGDFGILLPQQSHVSNVSARWNQNDGISVTAGSTVEDCLVFGNGVNGISSSGGVTIRGNTTRDNGDDGIAGGIGSLIVNNLSNSNDGDGISAGSFGDDVAYVRENITRSNTGFGLNLEPDTPYIGNVVDNNTGGTVSGGLPLGVNSCDGTASCP